MTEPFLQVMIVGGFIAVVAAIYDTRGDRYHPEQWTDLDPDIEPELPPEVPPASTPAALTYRTTERDGVLTLVVELGSHTFEYPGAAASQFLDDCDRMANSYEEHAIRIDIAEKNDG